MKHATRLLITLDYELFFGNPIGTVEQCLLRPLDALLPVVDRHDVRLCLFIDAGFLVRLRAEAERHSVLRAELARIEGQLRGLAEAGHDLQLHIHPHWEESRFDGDHWQVDTRRYRLHDFGAADVRRIVADYKAAIERLSGRPVFAYRAGGWCLQPFDQLAEALAAQGIWLDSTVYADGLSEDPVRHFDFRGAPRLGWWRFDTDPLIADERGRFVEVPISACRVAPLFFWRMLLAKKLASASHRAFGDGRAMRASAGYYLRLLTRPSHSVASIDGLKAGFLERAFRQNSTLAGTPPIFNLMGHPKALSPHSIDCLDRFLRRHPELEPITFRDLEDLKIPLPLSP